MPYIGRARKLTPTEPERPFAQSSLSVLMRHLENSAEGSAFRKAVQSELAIRGRQAVHNVNEFFDLISRSKQRTKEARAMADNTSLSERDRDRQTLLTLERKVDVLLQWVCHLVDLTWETERLLKFPLQSENKNPNQKN